MRHSPFGRGTLAVSAPWMASSRTKTVTMTTSKDQTLTPRFPPGLRSRILQPCRASLLPPITSTCQTLLVLPHSVNQTPRLTHHRLTRVVRAAAAAVLNHHNDLRGANRRQQRPRSTRSQNETRVPCLEKGGADAVVFWGGCVGVVVCFLVPSPFFSSSSSLSLCLSLSVCLPNSVTVAT